MARELGDDGAFFTIEIDDISIAVATFVGAVGNFGSVGGELGAVAKSGVLGELAGVGSVDVRKIDLFYLGFFPPEAEAKVIRLEAKPGVPVRASTKASANW